jgi:hypothetical protein
MSKWLSLELSLLLLVSMVAFAGFVSLQSGDSGDELTGELPKKFLSSKAPTARTPTPLPVKPKISCFDNDGGYNPGIFGTVSNKDGNKRYDACVSELNLLEYGCQDNGYESRTSVNCITWFETAYPIDPKVKKNMKSQELNEMNSLLMKSVQCLKGACRPDKNKDLFKKWLQYRTKNR